MTAYWTGVRHLHEIDPARDDVTDGLASAVAGLLPSHCSRDRVALYVATEDAGASVAIGFWREVLAKGAAFANPRQFPWTLSNSIAADLACRAALTGPNTTLVGAAPATMAALRDGIDDLDGGAVDAVLIVAVDLPYDGASGRAVVALLSPEAGPDASPADPHRDEDAPTGCSAATLLDRITQ